MRSTKLVLLWLVSGFALSALVALIGGGLFAAIFHPQAGDPFIRLVVGAGILTLSAFLSWFVMLSPAILTVCLVWPLAVRRLPSIEGAGALVLILSSVAALVALTAWLIFVGEG